MISFRGEGGSGEQDAAILARAIPRRKHTLVAASVKQPGTGALPVARRYFAAFGAAYASRKLIGGAVTARYSKGTVPVFLNP